MPHNPFKNLTPARFHLALLPLLTTLSATPQLIQWPATTGGNNHFYEVVPAATGITWDNASAAATSRGGYLATITSAAENAFIFNLAEPIPTVWYNGYGPWLGGLQPAGAPEPAGGWSWVTGEPFTYRNWTSGQPNNNQNEDRIHFGGQANRSSTWNDVGRNTTTFTRGYIVEYNQHPNAVTLSISQKDADEIQLSWPSRSTVLYTIEWTENLEGDWAILTTVIGSGATITLDDLISGPPKFYRCVVPQ